MSASDTDRSPVIEIIWQGIEAALTYEPGEPWPYALSLKHGVSEFVLLDPDEVVELRDAIDQHLAGLGAAKGAMA